MLILILGIKEFSETECLKNKVYEAVKALQIRTAIVEINDIEGIIHYNLRAIPALIVNGQIVFQKRSPSLRELKSVLESISLNTSENTKRRVLAS